MSYISPYNGLDANSLALTISNLSNQVKSMEDIVKKYEQSTIPIATAGVNQVEAANGVKYPVNKEKIESVEEIISDPAYLDNLKQEFYTTDIGKKMMEEQDTEFLLFCEQKTRYPSVTLNKIRQQNDMEKYPTAKTRNPKGQFVKPETPQE